MKVSDFEIGHAIKYVKRNKLNKLKLHYGLVVDVSDVDISFVVVSNLIKCLPDGGYYKMLCYDDAGAVYEKHKDNVRLRNCPPPFVELSDGVKDAVYACAAGDKVMRFTEKEIHEYNVCLIDSGIKVDDDVIAEVLHHPFPQQLQKQFTYQRSLPDDVSKQSDKDDGFGIE